MRLLSTTGSLAFLQSLEDCYEHAVRIGVGGVTDIPVGLLVDHRAATALISGDLYISLDSITVDSLLDGSNELVGSGC